VNEAMYVSGLAHVLSISGYHMAVVAGMIFFAVRALFALLPAFSNRHPIKKWVTAVPGCCPLSRLVLICKAKLQRAAIPVRPHPMLWYPVGQQNGSITLLQCSPRQRARQMARAVRNEFVARESWEPVRTKQPNVWRK
jgi:Competence protein